MDQLPHKITCPYCWQQLDILIDPSLDHQQYVEDCQVCCNPIVLTLCLEDNENFQIIAQPE